MGKADKIKVIWTKESDQWHFPPKKPLFSASKPTSVRMCCGHPVKWCVWLFQLPQITKMTTVFRKKSVRNESLVRNSPANQCRNVHHVGNAWRPQGDVHRLAVCVVTLVSWCAQVTDSFSFILYTKCFTKQTRFSQKSMLEQFEKRNNRQSHEFLVHRLSLRNQCVHRHKN